MRLYTLLKKVFLKLGLIADYIVETGSVNGWRYIKWNSGNCLLMLDEFKSVTYSTSLSLMGGHGGTFRMNEKLPISLVGDKNKAVGDTCNGSGIGWANFTVVPPNILNGYTVSNNPQSSGGWIRTCIIYGRWK